MKFCIYQVLLAFVIVILYSGCASSGYWKHEPFVPDSTTVSIASAELDSLQNHSNAGNMLYSGFGRILKNNFRGWRGCIINIRFDKALYNPSDSLLYLEGQVLCGDEPYIGKTQIIIGILPDLPDTAETGKIDIGYINLVNDNESRFAMKFRLYDKYQFIFCDRENYYDNGEIADIYVGPMVAYDFYKLIDRYKARKY